MTPTVPNRPAQYRARARLKAESEPDEIKRKNLLHNAEVWERMADYEDQNPSHNFQSYYPKALKSRFKLGHYRRPSRRWAWRAKDHALVADVDPPRVEEHTG